jgi:hypothetical protein
MFFKKWPWFCMACSVELLGEVGGSALKKIKMEMKMTVQTMN